ncbi:MAG: paraquat-inducible protein A [Magnetococcales bacterium]|nr:paraquat-inducible protein A [Magnetococcales bacterium]
MQIEPAFSACPACDLLFRRRPLPHGMAASCPRCGTTLGVGTDDPVSRPLALALASLILFFVVSLEPLLVLRLGDREVPATLFGAVLTLVDAKMYPLAFLVFWTSLLAPLTTLLGLILCLWPLRQGGTSRLGPGFFRIALALLPWALVGIYFLSVLLALFKLKDLAEIHLGAAMVAFAALVVTMTALRGSLHPEPLWERLELLNDLEHPDGLDNLEHPKRP